LRDSFVQKGIQLQCRLIVVVIVTNTPAYCVAELITALTVIVVVKVVAGAEEEVVE
jgi:hypothetical protein